MILILTPNIHQHSPEYRQLMKYLSDLPNLELRIHCEQGVEKSLTEVHLIGNTTGLSHEHLRSLPGVEQVVRISEAYRVLGRHAGDHRAVGFCYQGIRFGQDNLNVFAGLCAVDTPRHVETMMRALRDCGQVCTRMGAYKPRTSPYSFQGHGKQCLPYVFELAGQYGIKIIAMEVTRESHIDEICEALDMTGNPTGVMLQIGTRNTQNFELLKSVGRQHQFPVLIKRSYGITLDESLHAAEYLASEGNTQVVFALRGTKTSSCEPHRNSVDFAFVPVVKRLTRMPVCIDPSHSVGTRASGPEGILDIMHVTAQGVIAGANMILVDFHPAPDGALVDAAQALHVDQLEFFLEDVQIAREAYEKRLQLQSRHSSKRDSYEPVVAPEVVTTTISAENVYAA